MPTDELAGNGGASVATRDWVALEVEEEGRFPPMNTKRINHDVNMLHGKPTAAVPVSLSLSHPSFLIASCCLPPRRTLMHHNFLSPLSSQLGSLSWPRQRSTRKEAISFSI